MSGDMLAWIVIFSIASAIVSVMVMRTVLLPRVVRTMKAEFYCPWVHRDVMVQYLTRDGRRPIGVFSCTAFGDRTSVICGMPCLGSNGRTSVEDQKDDVLDLLNDSEE